ncbi:MAG: four helix bundle protein [Bacteroidales bacterium]|nr:four helix bundle protein [Bacteroidales bacterium]MCB9013689.1 four helix bundle protein [Bacteroidales bacterium]
MTLREKLTFNIMSITKCHEDLEIWKLSIDLVKETYLKTRVFSEEEKYGVARFPQIKTPTLSRTDYHLYRNSPIMDSNYF